MPARHHSAPNNSLSMNTTMPSSSPAKDKDYHELKVAYELRTLMRESKVDVTERIRGVQKFTRFGRAYIRYMFNQCEEVSVPVLVVAFSATADEITAIINNNYDRKKVKNGDNVVEDDRMRKQDLKLLASIDNWIAGRANNNKVKEDAEEKSNPFLVPLASPASTVALEPAKKKRYKKAKKQDKNEPAQPNATEDLSKGYGTTDKGTSKKRKNREKDLAGEEDNLANRPTKARKPASTAGLPYLPVTSFATTDGSCNHSKNAKKVKQTTTPSKKANIPNNFQANTHQPLSEVESLELMDMFFKKAGGPYKLDFLHELVVDKFGPQELFYLKQFTTQEKMMETLNNIDIPTLNGRPLRLSSFTEAVVNAKEGAWKMLKEELEKSFPPME